MIGGTSSSAPDFPFPEQAVEPALELPNELTTVDLAERYSLRAPDTDQEWVAYHAIRRDVLFERRGMIGVYDPTHPDETRPGNHALLLWFEREPIGTIRIDMTGVEAVFRRVAIRGDLQRRGHGRRLLALAERFARAHGAHLVRSHVDLGAVGFYERCGFERVGDARPGEAPVMKKVLTSAGAAAEAEC